MPSRRSRSPRSTAGKGRRPGRTGDGSLHRHQRRGLRSGLGPGLWGGAPNFASPKTTKEGIGYAAIDGSGGAILPLAPADAPKGGLAVDDAGGRVYWISREEKIVSMKLDGSDLATLDTGTAPLVKPANIAIDEATRTLYWTNEGARAISFAKLDGSGAVGG